MGQSITLPDLAADGADGPDAAGALVSAAVAGDRAAMQGLLEAVAPVVVRACRRVLGRGNPEVDDVAQLALAGFVDALPTFRGESSVVHFAERIAVYRSLSARRDACVRRRHVDVSPSGDEVLLSLVSDDGSEHEARVEDGQRRGLLARALAALPEPQAEALTLHFLFDHTVGEIAAMVGAPAETVRSRLRLGKQALRVLITQDAALSALREVTS